MLFYLNYPAYMLRTTIYMSDEYRNIFWYSISYENILCYNPRNLSTH